ncbi:MAG: hypothetical protein IJC53_00185 [Clostridia bacterium]|nr:hypothetical protein [Clostridia bacterium]
MSIVVFGEMLWDIWPQEKHIGGAPFNFAAHLRKLGAQPTFVSAVGRDALGNEALERVAALDLDPSCIAKVGHPTGACHVTQDHEGRPSYRLLTDVAYDYIPLPDSLPAPKDSLLYFGSLAQRSPVSWRTLSNLLSLRFTHVFCDINLRPPFFSRDILLRSLSACTILKVSREEYEVLSDLELIHVDNPADYSRAFCRAVVTEYPNIRTVIVTLDKDGAMVYDAGTDIFCFSRKPGSKLVSAVGAGDSFSACFCANLLKGRPLPECQDCGVLLSDYVVTQPGAVPDYPPELLKKLI